MASARREVTAFRGVYAQYNGVYGTRNGRGCTRTASLYWCKVSIVEGDVSYWSSSASHGAGCREWKRQKAPASDRLSLLVQSEDTTDLGHPPPELFVFLLRGLALGTVSGPNRYNFTDLYRLLIKIVSTKS